MAARPENPVARKGAPVHRFSRRPARRRSSALAVVFALAALAGCGAPPPGDTRRRRPGWPGRTARRPQRGAHPGRRAAGRHRDRGGRAAGRGRVVVPYSALLYQPDGAQRGLHGHRAAHLHAGHRERREHPGQPDLPDRAHAGHQPWSRPAARNYSACRTASGCRREPDRRGAAMRWLVGCSLRFRYLVVGLAAGLLFFGVQLLGHEKLDVFPEFAPVSVEIQTTCLGLSPQEVESLTTVPLEAALQGVPGVADVQSVLRAAVVGDLPVLPVRHEPAARPAAGPGAAADHRTYAADLVRSAADVPDRVGDQPGHADRLHLRRRCRPSSCPRSRSGRSGPG